MLKEKAITLEAEFLSLPRDEANERTAQLKIDDPALHKKLVSVVEERKLGLTYIEKSIKQLGVENGERAQYIFNKTEQLETREEKNDYIKNLQDKKLISKQVREQLVKLIKASQ